MVIVKYGVAAALLLCAGARADVLWDQSGFDPFYDSVLVDQSFPDSPDFDAYMVNDVLVGGNGWTVSSVTTYFSHGWGDWPDVGHARLNIFKKTGALPNADDDPGSGLRVPVTISVISFGYSLSVNASGLDIDLAPGEYWIGLTPDIEYGLYLQEYHLPAQILGADTAWRNPGGAFGIGTHWQNLDGIDDTDSWVGLADAAMLVEGAFIPAPGAGALFGMGAILARRRRD